MKRTALSLLSGVALVCSVGGSSAYATPVPLDAFNITIGGTNVTFTAISEVGDLTGSVFSGLFDANFKPGTVYLTDPGTSLVSDILTISAAPGRPGQSTYTVTYTSDFDPPDLGTISPGPGVFVETGSFQDVSSVFGLGANAVLIQSDLADQVPVPEPASMTLLGSGLIALGMLMRRRRRKAA